MSTLVRPATSWIPPIPRIYPLVRRVPARCFIYVDLTWVCSRAHSTWWSPHAYQHCDMDALDILVRCCLSSILNALTKYYYHQRDRRIHRSSGQLYWIDWCVCLILKIEFPRSSSLVFRIRPRPHRRVVGTRRRRRCHIAARSVRVPNQGGACESGEGVPLHRRTESWRILDVCLPFSLLLLFTC